MQFRQAHRQAGSWATCCFFLCLSTNIHWESLIQMTWSLSKDMVTRQAVVVHLEDAKVGEIRRERVRQ